MTINPEDYKGGSDRYIRFTEDLLGVTLAETQKRILRAVTQNQRVLIVSGNGVGKSYGVAMLIAAFLYTNVDSTSLGTSGSYSQFIDTMWRPLSSIVKRMRNEYDMPGSIYEGNQQRIELDDEWYFKVSSPRDPGDLEGRHAADVLVVIEESDKEYITEEHFDSAGSSITDANDRMIAVANPPKDETNVVYDKMRSDRWTLIQFSSFESHNVQVDLGNIDADKLPGLVDLDTIAGDWEAWNNEPWPMAEEAYEERFDSEYPGVDSLVDSVRSGEIERETMLDVIRPGVDVAKFAHEERTDLDIRWYRRRAGVIPPDNAQVYRPFTVEEIEKAYERDDSAVSQTPRGVSLDVARSGGDYNVMAGKYAEEIQVIDRWQGVDHNVNESFVREYTENFLSGTYFSVDAQGEGSGLADRISTFYPDTIRFHAGEEATDGEKFYDKWTEGLYLLGKFFREGGSFKNRRLREELLTAARHVEMEEKYYKSRDAKVLKASSKDNVKDALDRSPDMLDAAYMAVWSASDAAEGRKKKQMLTW